MTDTKKAYPTDEAIAAVMAERKLNRIGAVQFLRRQAAKSASAAQPKAAVESKPKAAKRKAVKPSEKAPITKDLREKLDRLLRATAGKDAVENRLKLCHSPKYHRYEFWGTANGNVVNVSIDGMKAHLMPQDSNTVKGWKKTLREREKAEAKIAAAKAEAKKA
jgi:hypothetical protein